MAEWTATVSGKDYDLRALTVTIAFDGMTWMDVWFRQGLNRGEASQAELQVKRKGQDIGPSLSVVANLNNDGIRVQPAPPKAEASAKAFTLCQQVENGGLTDLFATICGGDSIGSEDIHFENVDQKSVLRVLPKDTCVAMRNTLTHDARFSRLVDLLAARGVVIGGWIRMFGSKKKMKYVFVGDEAASTAILNTQEWFASASRDSLGDSFRLTRDLPEGESASAIAKQLLGANKVTVNYKDTFPVAPTWVQFGKDRSTAMFASRVTTQLSLNETNATGSQGHTILELTDRSARSQRSTGFASVMLLGKISAPAEEKESFVRVKPWADQPPAFETWKMAKKDEALTVYFTATGYLGKEPKTLYVPLRTNDIVAFVASEASPPLAVGALGAGLGKKEELIGMWDNVTFHRNVIVKGEFEVE